MSSAGSIRAGQAFVEILADNQGLERGLSQAKGKLSDFDREVSHGVHGLFSKRGLFQAGAVGAGIYAALHVAEGVSEGLKEINETGASGGAAWAIMTEQVIKSVPVLGEVYTVTAKIAGELDGSAQAMRELTKQTDEFTKSTKSLKLMADESARSGFQIRALGIELAKLHGLQTEGSQARLAHDEAVKAVHEQISKIRAQARAAGTQGTPQFMKDLDNLRQILKLLDDVQAAKTGQATDSAPNPHPGVSDAWAAVDKALAESKKPGHKRMNVEDSDQAYAAAARSNMADATGAVDEFIGALQDARRAIPSLKHPEISPEQAALDRLIARMEQAGTPLSRVDINRGEMAVQGAETRRETEKLTNEARHLLASAQTADEKQATYLERLKKMVTGEIITPAQRDKILNAANPTKIEAQGTFNSMAVLGLQGSGSTQDRIAAATEATAKNTAKAISIGPMSFQ